MIQVRLARLASNEVNDHWLSTMNQKRTLMEIKSFLSEQQLTLLEKEGKSEFNFWGDTDVTETRSRKIKQGDQIIFYGEKKFHSKAIAGPAFENEKLADYFWPHRSIGSTNKDNKAWKNIYVIDDLNDIHIEYIPKEILTKGGAPRESELFRSATYLEKYQLTPEFLSKLSSGGWEEGIVNNENTGRGIPRDRFIPRAQIYETIFSLDGINFIYVGQDLKCDPSYFGSSLVIYHYKKIYGVSIFKKTVIEELSNVTKGEINDIESEEITRSKHSIIGKDDWHSINYTGENQR